MLRYVMSVPFASRNGDVTSTHGGGRGGGGGLMNKIARSNRGRDVLSFASKHAWQPRGASNVHTLLSVNQKLLDRVEAENAQLRGSVVDLMLNIQALRDALGHPQSETQPHRPSANRR